MAEMTDAQVALMAASQQREVSPHAVLIHAARYLTWLKENSE